MESEFPAQASPFLKWAGGKNQLLHILDRYFPASFGRYYEPFLGGGAVFFHLVRKNKLSKTILSDSNVNLMNCYNVIRYRIEDLIAKLREVQCHRGSGLFFHEARQRFNAIKLDTSLECDVEKAALLIYLNKTCFNGLYRVNRLGNFNVPWGRYKRPRILDETNLRAVNTVLNRPGIQLTHGDYTQSTQSARKQDFVYFDPPYQPLSRTASFTSYTENIFELKDQMRLANLFQDLDSRGCLLMLSNSPRAESLFAGHGYRIERVKAARAINSVGSRRGPVDEILVMNY